VGHGCHGWDRYSEDKQHYALITDDSGTSLGEEIYNPATAVWLVGVYSHGGWGYSHCEQVAGRWKCSSRSINTFVASRQFWSAGLRISVFTASRSKGYPCTNSAPLAIGERI
jgi:hypothetical protein